MRLPAYVWIIVLFVFASLGIVGAFVYQNNARKADAERRAAAIAEAERQTAQAVAEKAEREEREAKDRQAKADEADRMKAQQKADTEARAKRIADEARRKYDLMSDRDRRRIDRYRSLIATHGEEAPTWADRRDVWFLIGNSDQFPSHDIVGLLEANADKNGVVTLAASQKASGRTLTILKIEFALLSVGERQQCGSIMDKVQAQGIGGLTDAERGYIRENKSLFPLWSR